MKCPLIGIGRYDFFPYQNSCSINPLAPTDNCIVDIFSLVLDVKKIIKKDTFDH